MAELKDNELYYWHKNTADYRENLDLATIFWLWNKVEKNFDPTEKFNLIANVIGIGNIQHVDPYQLWREVGVPQTERLLIPIPNGITSLAINLAQWKEIYQGTLNQTNLNLNLNINDYSLQWFARYREGLKFATPFSDYYVINTNPDNPPTEAIIIFKDTPLNKPQNTNSSEIETTLAMYELIQLEGMISQNKKHIADYGITNPILGDAQYTHSFINLDTLIAKASEQGIKLPPALISSEIAQTIAIDLPPQAANAIPIVDNAPHTTNSPTIDITKETYSVDIGIKFDRNEQFPLLKLAPIIIKYLKHDPRGKKLLKEPSETKIKKALQDRTELCEAHIAHIWRLIVQPNRRRSKTDNNLHIQKNISDLINTLWECDDLENMWKKGDKGIDREMLLIGLGYDTKEAKSILSLLSAIAQQNSQSLKKEQLIQYRDLLMGINLSWTENLFLYD